MRILIHDRPGYAFPVQLSRELARRGHTVLHSYGAFFQGPKGELQKRPDDPPGLSIDSLQLKRPFKKYSLVQRLIQEIAYGQLVVNQIRAFSPDVIFFSNTPSEAQAFIYWRCRRLGVPFVYWLQDVYGLALQKLLARRSALLGKMVGGFYGLLDRFLLRRSDQIILITEDFRPYLQAWGIDEAKTHVIPNWSPLDAFPVYSKKNRWSRRQRLDDKICLLYSGTLGMKHNPDHLLQLALALKENAQIRVVVVSEGLGAAWLRERQAKHRLENLVLLDYQPFAEVAQMLATADILLAILEPDAGIFSVPSKVLAYLCAARPILMAIPPENLAARIVSQQQAGWVVPPDQTADFIARAKLLIADPDLRDQMGQNGRAYAEAHFDIARIADRFEEIIRSSGKSRCLP